MGGSHAHTGCGLRICSDDAAQVSSEAHRYEPSAVGAANKAIGSNKAQGEAYVFSPVGLDTIFCDGFDGTGVCK